MVRLVCASRPMRILPTYAIYSTYCFSTSPDALNISGRALTALSVRIPEVTYGKYLRLLLEKWGLYCLFMIIVV